MDEDKDNQEVNKSNLNDISKLIDERNSTFNFESSDTSSYLPGLKRKSMTIYENRTSKFLRYKSDDFSNINPLRDINKKRISTKQPPLKEKAIMESVVNLKIQYILFNIKDFIRKYQIKTNPKINNKIYKFLVIVRNLSLFAYGLIILFEKPWFCYNKATIPLPQFFNFTTDCNKIAFLGIPFMNIYLFRMIELFLSLIFFIIQILKYKNEYLLKESNIGTSKYYDIIQVILLFSLVVCIIDLSVSLFTGDFPIVNFILRSFIYIYLIRRIRRNWVRIGKILWRTKNVFMFLFMNIFLFSAIGYFLFKKVIYFKTFHGTVLQLYILLTTCNFPDIMLETFSISKLSIFYFMIYLSINYFIILSYLKTLYYTKYYVVNKEDCLAIIKYIIQNNFNKDIFKLKQFKKYLYELKYSYSLNDNEYTNILVLLNIYDNSNDLFNYLTKIVEKTPEEKMITDTLYGKYILRSKVFEMVINIICIITVLISRFDNISILFLFYQFNLFGLLFFYLNYILLLEIWDLKDFYFIILTE